MGRELFGTDGVRGIAGDYPLDHDGATSIGRAIGAHFAQAGQALIIGSDPRQSSAGLVEAVTTGLTEMGVNVVSAGVLPTPGLAYLTRQGDFVAGVMVTASHNPVEYNGIKCFDGQGGKLPDETEARLNELILNGVQPRGQGQFRADPGLVKQYEDFLVQSAGGLNLTGLKLAVDSANGAASGLAARVFERLGAQVTPLFDQPDGRNINDHCGATDTGALAKLVSGQGLDLGVALDGDADRLVMIDDRGREIKGDYIMYIIAVTQGLEGVVATEMSNQGFEQSLGSHGIRVYRTKVGDRYVLEGLHETGYKLGGEQSGHIIMPALLATGDGLLAAVQTLAAVANSDKTLAQWCDEVKLLPQALVNIPLQDKALLGKDEVKSYIDQQNQALANRGRLLIRPSGTEPLARIMVEAPDAETEANRIADDLKNLLGVS